MEKQKFNLSKLANSNNHSNKRNNTYINQAQEIKLQLGETQILPKIEANQNFCYNSSRFWSNLNNNKSSAIRSKFI